MNFRHASLILSASLLASACSSTGLFDKKIDYKSAENAAKNRLEVPPDLTRPQLNNNYALPGASSVSAQQLNQQAQANLINKNPSNVLIDIPVARMERAGQQRWLVVQKKPEELWPLLKEFWIDNGFILKQDAPEIGVMETDWAENRAKIPQDGIRNLLSKVGLDNVYSTPERDKFRARIERTNAGTEVYFSHRGMYETFVNEGKAETMWQPRPADPELEAEMLGRFMMRMGISEEKVKLAAQKPDANQPQRASVQGEAVLVNDAFDRAWRRTGLALDRIGLLVTDRDRSQGVYYIRPAQAEMDKSDESGGFWSSLLFWRSSDKPASAKAPLAGGDYQVRVKAVNDSSSQVLVLDKNGQALPANVSRPMLARLQQQLQ
jgi:outer membrane protein assembly factor BamC